jgi:hypothetical protein
VLSNNEREGASSTFGELQIEAVEGDKMDLMLKSGPRLTSEKRISDDVQPDSSTFIQLKDVQEFANVSQSI